MDEDIILTLVEGEDYSVSLTFEEDDGRPIRLGGYTELEAQIRESFTHNSGVLASFSVNLTGVDENIINMTLLHAQTSELTPAISPKSPRGAGAYWDVFGVNPAGNRRLLAKGRVRFIHTITSKGRP